MALQCGKSFDELDGLREKVKSMMQRMLDENQQMMTYFNYAVQVPNDVVALNKAMKEAFDALERRWEFDALVNEWEKKTSEFKKEVLDTVLDKAKRDKDKDALGHCSNMRDYVEAANDEIASLRKVSTVVGSMYGMVQSTIKVFQKLQMAS